jgi:hypothetical protein
MNGRSFDGSNGTQRKRAEAPKRRKGPTSKPTKAQLAAREQYLRDAERATGVKITKADVEAVLAELAALR